MNTANDLQRKKHESWRTHVESMEKAWEEIGIWELGETIEQRYWEG